MDDHLQFRQAVVSLLAGEPDLRVVGEAADGETAVDLVGRLAPDVVLMDIKLGGMDGVEATGQIVAEQPGCGVVMVSIHWDRWLVDRALGAGAVGFVAKDRVGRDLVAAIRAVAAGGGFLSRELAAG